MNQSVPHIPDDGQAVPEVLATANYLGDLLVASEFDLDQLLEEVVRTTAEQLNLKGSAVRLLDHTTGELVVHAQHGLGEWFLSEGPRYGIESRFRRMIAGGGILRVDDVLDEPDLRFAEAASRVGIRSLLGVGLHVDGELIGAISVYADTPQAFTETQIESLRLIANKVSVAIQLARLHAANAERKRLEHDLEVAAEIQRRILPNRSPDVPGFTIASRYVPWEQVGGDFFDFVDLPQGNIGVVVGDVTGKGIRAALLSVVVQTAVRAHAEYEYSIGEILTRVNRTLHEMTGSEQFATLVYGVLDTKRKIFTYVTALCPPPILIRDGAVHELETEGLPVGISEDQKYIQDFIELESGDLIVAYSDGYTEILNDEGEMFGDERLRDCVLANHKKAPAELIDLLESEIEAFLDGSDHGDDRTIVVISAS